MLKFNIYSLTLGCLLALAGASASYAADAQMNDQPFSAGALLGVGDFTQNNNVGARFDFGVMGNYRFENELAVGLTFLGTNIASAYFASPYGNTYTTSLNLYYFNLNVNYNLIDGPVVLWVGGRAGVAFVNITQTDPTGFYTYSTSTAAFDFGPAIGIDFMVSHRVSLGLEANYLWANFNNFFNSGTNVQINTFNALASIKIYFEPYRGRR